MPVVTSQSNPSVQTLVKPWDKKRKTVHHLAREESKFARYGAFAERPTEIRLLVSFMSRSFSRHRASSAYLGRHYTSLPLSLSLSLSALFSIDQLKSARYKSASASARPTAANNLMKTGPAVSPSPPPLSAILRGLCGLISRRIEFRNVRSSREEPRASPLVNRHLFTLVPPSLWLVHRPFIASLDPPCLWNSLRSKIRPPLRLSRHRQ
jgi:hypothetical protein